MNDLTPQGPSPEAEDRRKHLDHVLAVATRMATASSAAKGWLLPVVTATYGYGLTKDAPSIVLLGVGAVVLFAFLDANYLRDEHIYRALYLEVAKKTVTEFSMELPDNGRPSTRSLFQKLFGLVGRWIPGPKEWLSWSIAPFYGSMLAAGLYIYWNVK
jgi:hypothetical protein